MSEEIEEEKKAPVPISGYITELSDDDILQLKDEDLQRMIRLKMASEGIKILVRPELPTYHVLPEKDVEVFTIEALGQVAFRSIEDAQAVQKVLVTNQAKMVYFWSYSDSVDITKQTTQDFTIKSERLYSTSLWDRVKGSKKENDALKKVFDEEMNKFDSNEEDTEWVRNEVMMKFQKVKYNRADMDAKCEKFREYWKLADENEDVAWAFLRQAYAVNLETERYIRSWWANLEQK